MAQETLWFAALAAALFSGNSLIDRYILRDMKETGAYGAIAYLGAALLAGVYLVFFPRVWETSGGGWMLAVIAALLWGCFTFVWLKADTIVDAPLKSPFRLLSVAFSLALAAVFLGETFTWVAAVSFGLILIGTGVASYKEKSFHTARWSQSALVLMTLGAALAALASFTDKHVIASFDLLAYAFVNWLAAGVVMLLTAKPTVKNARMLVTTKPGWLALRSVLEVLAYVAWLTAYTRATYGGVTLVMQLIIPFTFVGGVLLLRERDNLKLRILGAAIALTGGILAALYA